MPNVAKLTTDALTTNNGILRLTPTWVPRSFLQPGRRLKLHPNDYYSFGMNRGGIDERWFGSTTEAANENRREDEGLSYVVHKGERFLLKDAIAELKSEIIGDHIWKTFQKWPVYSKFFDNMGPIPHHMHQNAEQAKLVGQEGKPESYYFPPQMNQIGNNFPYTFMGLEPGTTRQDVVDCLDRWNEGENGLLDLSKAYRLKPGTGWLIPPCVLHAPGSLVTYEPQWGSDVFAMYQNLVEGREVPRSLLTKDFPEEKHNDNAYIVDALDWDRNVDPSFKDNNYLEPIISEEGDGWCDKWIVYGKVGGKQLFTAKELTLQPGAKCTVKDGGAYCWITVQGMGSIEKMHLQSPVMIRFGEMTEDEVFVSASRATEGVTYENTGTEPLVGLRYFGPDAQPGAPELGAWEVTRNDSLLSQSCSGPTACCPRIRNHIMTGPWWLVTFDTYASWLPGDPRGFKTWRKREYIPPVTGRAQPGEELYNAKNYEQRFKRASEDQRFDSIRLNVKQCVTPSSGISS